MTHYVTKASSDKVSHIDQFSGTKAPDVTLPSFRQSPRTWKTVGCAFGLLRGRFTHPLSVRAYRARPHP